jgi:hypothetical protein
MKLFGLFFIFVFLLWTSFLLAEGEEEVTVAELVEKASEYDGKTVRLNCQILICGSEYLAVDELKGINGKIDFEGAAVLLKKTKSTIKKKLEKAKYNKKTCYFGTVTITGEVKAGEFGKKKEYKVQITVKSVETSGSGDFETLKKNIRTKTDVPPENDVRSARQAVRRDGFNPPTYPKYNNGSGLSDSTQVLCISDGKKHKIYTIGSMGTCELVNDKIGKVPVAVTW